MAGKTFTPTKRDRKPIAFSIARPDGESDDYSFDPPKVAGAVMPAIDPTTSDDDEGGRTSMTQAAWAWLKQGLGEDQYGRIRKRLDDEHDDLDIGDVAQIVKWLMGKVAGRPTS